jgi:chromosome partitioning protein
MIVALLNQKGGVGKATLALHLAGAWAAQGKRVVVIDADPQGSALDWSAQPAKEAVPRLFCVIDLARDTLHRAAPELARDADHIVIDGPPRVASLLRSTLLAADLVLIPAQPSPFNGWASAEMLRLLEEAHIFRPQLVARVVLNRCAARTVIARETADGLADHDPPVLASRSARDRRLGGRSRSGDAMIAHPADRGFASRPGDPESWVRSPEPSATAHGAGDLFTARLTVDVTPELRARIKITSFQRGQTVADMLRDLLAREFPATDGGQT